MLSYKGAGAAGVTEANMRALQRMMLYKDQLELVFSMLNHHISSLAERKILAAEQVISVKPPPPPRKAKKESDAVSWFDLRQIIWA